MRTVVRRVADVVHEVARTRRSAVRDEGGERLDPPTEIAELCGEDDAREEEQVLRPLAGPQRHERRAKRRARARELVDGCRVRKAHATRRLFRAGREDELEATAFPEARVERDASTQRRRELMC